ncbi:MAG: branched-chain amino acid transaminase [Deltaproteobacteria bacterium]|nr:branched-chain amino acid transaminase [Deltaproteobacteria bacterium]
MPKADWIWMDGEWLPFDEAKVHVLTHTLHYGLGVFEGIRCYATEDEGLAIFRLQKHLRRLYDSAKICLMDIPYPIEDLVEVCLDAVRKNGNKACYLRPLVFVGDGAMGLGTMANPVRVMVAAWEWGAYLGAEGLKNGIRAKVSTFTRAQVNHSMVKGKIVGQYVTSILAKREALLQGFDEAIFLDPEGYVSEASGENIFAVRNGRLWTTPVTGTILAGVTRDAIVQIARDRGYEVREQLVTRDFLWIADEVFMTGTAAEVTPVREIDNRPVGTGKAGPITLELQSTFFDVVSGKLPQYKDWLTRV